VPPIRHPTRGLLNSPEAELSFELSRPQVNRMDCHCRVTRRAQEAGLPSSTCCHTFRATGITIYLENGGTIENAQAIAAHDRRVRRSSATARATRSRSTRWSALRFEGPEMKKLPRHELKQLHNVLLYLDDFRDIIQHLKEHCSSVQVEVAGFAVDDCSEAEIQHLRDSLRRPEVSEVSIKTTEPYLNLSL
jgi:hypothetical protein